MGEPLDPWTTANLETLARDERLGAFIALGPPINGPAAGLGGGT